MEKTRINYETPWKVIWWLQKRFEIAFDLDPCCTVNTNKAVNHFTKESDGLSHDWFGNVFMNPPWDNAMLPLFLDHAKKQASDCNIKLIVGLIPVRSDTNNWHKYILNKGAHELIFIKGRIKFILDGQVQKQPNMQNVCAFPVWRPGEPPDHPELYTVDVKEIYAPAKDQVVAYQRTLQRHRVRVLNNYFMSQVIPGLPRFFKRLLRLFQS